MKRTFGLILITWASLALSQDQKTQQVWSGRLSDSMCGASHQIRAAAGKLSERECIFECIKALANLQTSRASSCAPGLPFDGKLIWRPWSPHYAAIAQFVAANLPDLAFR